jgi:hypothetical protein
MVDISFLTLLCMQPARSCAFSRNKTAKVYSSILGDLRELVAAFNKCNRLS